MNLSKIIYNWCFCVQKIGNDIQEDAMKFR